MKLMSELNRILVPFDFSPISQQALTVAKWLIQSSSAELHLVHVNEPSMVYSHAGGTLPPSEVSAAVPTNEEMERRLAEWNVEGVEDNRLKRVVVNGDAAAAIVEYAKDNEIDLIVMTTHGHTGLSRLLVGSVAEEVVRKATCPVLTLRAMLDDEEKGS